MRADVVPDVTAAGPQRPVIVIDSLDVFVGKTDRFRQESLVVIRVRQKIHGQDHGVFVSLGLDGRDLSVGSEPVQVEELEGELAVFLPGEESPVFAG